MARAKSQNKAGSSTLGRHAFPACSTAELSCTESNGERSSASKRNCEDEDSPPLIVEGG